MQSNARLWSLLSLCVFSVLCAHPLLAQPVNDECPDAIEVTCGTSIAGNTMGATLDVPTPPTCSAPGDNTGVWYKFTGTGDSIVLSMCNGVAQHHTLLSVFTGKCGGAYTCVAGNDDSCNPGSFLTFNSIPGTEYLIFVDGRFGETGPFQLDVTCVSTPPNDICVTAIPLTCGQVATGETNTATPDSAPDCVITDSAAGVWFSWTGTGEDVAISTCNPGTNFNTELRVYTGDCSSLTCVTGNDNFCGAQSQVEFTSSTGEEYLILLHGFQDSGDFELSLTCSMATRGLSRGDCNADGLYNVADAIFALGALFVMGHPPVSCDDAGDANDDGGFNISDPIYVLTSLFSMGPDPLPPFPGCGADPTPDALECESFPPCP